MANPGMWRSPTRLYVNKDRSQVVPGDSPEAASVLVGQGGEIPRALADRYGLTTETPAVAAPSMVDGPAAAPQPPAVDSSPPEVTPSPEAEEAKDTKAEDGAETKAEESKVNKAVKPAENKGGK
jgi:hypothetical protein